MREHIEFVSLIRDLFVKNIAEVPFTVSDMT